MNRTRKMALSAIKDELSGVMERLENLAEDEEDALIRLPYFVRESDRGCDMWERLHWMQEALEALENVECTLGNCLE